jgi:hypothetical protein
MRLNDLVASAFNGAAATLSGATVKLKRNAILYGLCAACALAMLVLTVSASLLALEPRVGLIYARLILAGVFALALGAIVLTIWLTGRPLDAAPAAAQMNLHGQAQPAQRGVQFAQVAMIVEAVMLGYSLARKR